ncbi:Stealth CR1 domain-containing protein [Sulfitobacter sp. DSM 110093]|uniref:Stealth CR1 domain-containing protein n=1 Tax=Sulfitobacter sp. DSM 110093 TaxID=2883127 RepID=UPI001FAC8D77|nr:Stealth CR1 domain-containing protein [Sulfitobacter sp. DSM 110093]
MPIDTVISWVDGNDPAHAKRRKTYEDLEDVQHKTSKEPTRFDSQGEIYVCIASILKFMPFVRTIWVVTDGQKPPQLDWFAQSGFCGKNRIKIVDHQDILGDRENALPTFNSLTIEAALWRIQGLAEHHIYFNDDMFVKRTLTPEFFFTDAGEPIVRGSYRFFRSTGGLEWLKHEFLRPLRPNHWGRASFRTSQENAALIAGRTKQFILQEHWPHPMKASVLSQFYTKNESTFAEQLRHRFRKRSQHWPIALHNHLTVGDPASAPKVAYAKPGRREDEMLQTLIGDGADFGCMQSLDQFPKDKADRLFDGLVQIYSPFLRRDMLGR